MKNAFIVTILAALAVLALAGFLLLAVLPAGIAIDESSNGRQIALAKGQTLSLLLSANPSTGYTWEVSEFDAGVMRQAGEPVFQPASDLIGAPGTMTFTFQAVNAGETALTLVYHRPWENKTEPAQTFSIRIVVR